MDIRELREVCVTLIPHIENVEYSKPTPKNLLLALLERAIVLIDDYGKLELVQFLNEDLYSLVKTGTKTDSRVTKFKSDHYANTCELLTLVNKEAESELIEKKLPSKLVLRDTGSKGGAKNKQFHFFEFASDGSKKTNNIDEIYYDVVELAKCLPQNFTICGGNVFIDNGKNELKDRLIGKCRKAQTEHIYSFDHITKKGILLRPH